MVHSQRMFSATVLCLAFLGVLRAGDAAPEGLFHDLSLETALVQAAAQNRLVFIDFYTTRCGACQKLDENTWRDKKVIGLLKEKTIPLRINAGADASLRKKYAIQAYPTLLLLRPDGSVQERLLGYLPPEQFVESMQGAMAEKNSPFQAQEMITEAKK